MVSDEILIIDILRDEGQVFFGRSPLSLHKAQVLYGIYYSCRLYEMLSPEKNTPRTIRRGGEEIN